MWDTAGQEDYDRLRPLSYPNTDVFLLCFSLTSPDSLTNIESKWCPEIRSYCSSEKPRIIMIGTKSDLRDDKTSFNSTSQFQKIHSVTSAEAIRVAKKIHAEKYLECSALTQKGVKQVFEEIVKVALNSRKKMSKKRRMCVIC